MPQKDSNPTRLRLALQKSGRLTEKSFALLRASGLKFEHGKRNLIIPCEGLPIELLLVRDDDIPEFVQSGTCHLGIVGRNVLEEDLGPASDAVAVLRDLDFGHCRLSIAFPKGDAVRRPNDLQGKRIATTYPSILSRYLNAQDITADIVEVSGSVEIAPALSMADGICDLVSTGSTLKANGLVESFTVMKSQSQLIRSTTGWSEEMEHTLSLLLQRIDGVQLAQQSKYIMLNAPKDRVEAISELIPGMEKPSIIPLAENTNQVALHAVAKEEIFWHTMEKLKSMGASSILVMPIEKIIT